MTRPLPADGIAENGSGSRPGENQRARWTRILVTNPEGKNWRAVCLAVISLQRNRSGI
jgi:hypothetical protein